MTVGLLDAGVWALAILVAAVLHELTHVLIAGLVARDVQIDWRSLTVLSRFREDDGRWRDFAVGLGPIVAGLTLGVTSILVGAQPPLSMETAGLYLAWATYTIGGDLDDYLARVVETEPEWDEPWLEVIEQRKEAWREMTHLVSLGTVVAAVWLVLEIQIFLLAGVGIATAGFAHYLWRTVETDPRDYQEVRP